MGNYKSVHRAEQRQRWFRGVMSEEQGKTDRDMILERESEYG